MHLKCLETVIFTLSIFFLSANLIYGQEPDSSDNAYLQRIERFFSKIDSGKYDKAINFIYSGNPWIADKYEDIENVKKQFISLPEIVGSYADKSLLVKEEIAGRYVYLYYFVAFGRQPVSFVFEFYKPKDKWMIFSFTFADDVDTWVEERAKQKFYSQEN
ncbi:MAG: hypothetical protein ACE5GL_01425 [Calditrichia bacterium]